MARLVLSQPQTPIQFTPYGPGISGTVLFSSIVNLPAGSGCISDPYDFGPGPRPTQYTWRARTYLPGVVNQYDTISYLLVTSDDGVWWDANVGSGNRVLSSNQFVCRNMQYVGSLCSMSDTAQSGVNDISSGMVCISARYAAVACWNNTSSSLGSGNWMHNFTLTPYPDQVQ